MRPGRLAKLAAIAALTLVLVLVGFVDHHVKSARMHRADVAWWYCVNRSQGCGSNPELLEHRAQRIEHGWQQRERLYTLLLGMFLGAGLMVSVGGRRVDVSLGQPSRS